MDSLSVHVSSRSLKSIARSSSILSNELDADNEVPRYISEPDWHETSLSPFAVSPYLPETLPLPTDINALLLTFPFFGSSSQDFLGEISSCLHVRKFGPREIIVKQGEKGKAMFFIVKGTLQVTSADGEVELAVLESGSFFGEIAILYDLQRTANVVSKTPCTLVTLSSDDVKTALTKFPDIHELMRQGARERVKQMQDQLKKSGKGHSSDLDLVLQKDTNAKSMLTPQEPKVDKIAICTSSETELIQTSSPMFMNPLLSGRFDGRRKMSVAPWADNSMLKFAEAIANSQKESKLSRKMGSSKSTNSLAKSHSSIFSDFETVKTGILVLDHTIIAAIFKNLDLKTLFKLRRVSKRVLSILNDFDLGVFETMNLSLWSKQVNDAILLNVLKVSKGQTTSLNLKHCFQVTDQGLAHISSYIPQVQHLDLHSLWDVTDRGLSIMATKCGSITSMDLSNCRKITSKGMLEILSKARSLESLALSYCKSLTDEVMDHEQWSRMKRVNFQRCTGIFDTGFAKWKDFTGEVMLETNVKAFIGGHLRSVSCVTAGVQVNYQARKSPLDRTVTVCSPDSIDEDLPSNSQFQLFVTPADQDSPIKMLLHSQFYFRLTELNLADCSFLTDVTIRQVADKCPLLTKLSVSFCCSLSPEFAMMLVEGCPLLGALDASYCGNAITDQSLAIIGEGLLRLNVLAIRGCALVTDDGIKQLSLFAKNLRTVNFTQCKMVSANILDFCNPDWIILKNSFFDESYSSPRTQSLASH